MFAIVKRTVYSPVRNRILPYMALASFFSFALPSFASNVSWELYFTTDKPLKERIEDNKNDISSNKKKINESRIDIKNHADQLKQHQANIHNNERRTIDNETKINQNRSEIQTSAQDILKNREDISSANGLIFDNTQRINELNQQYHQFEKKTTSKFDAIDKRIGENHHKAMAGISSAMAMSAIPFIEGQQFSIGMGAGSYGGQGATALGTKFRINQQINTSAFASLDSTGNLGVAAGISYGW